MSYAKKLAELKGRIAVDDIRRISDSLEGRRMPFSSGKVRAIVSKYFMGEPEEISGRMGSKEAREGLCRELEGVKKAFGEEYPSVRAKAEAALMLSGRFEKIGTVLACISGAAAVGLFAAPKLGVQIPLFSRLAQHHGLAAAVAVGAGAIVAAAAAATLAVSHFTRKTRAILDEAGRIKDFVERALEFAAQEWKSQIMQGFRR